MKLEDIGFYTLSDKRCASASYSSNLERCELLITSKCNFKCPYCRGTDSSADISFEQAKAIVDKWCEEGLTNIRFSGGEPTVVPWLVDLVKYTKSLGWVKRIAISTNGSASTELYDELIEAGVDDFSISLDACCAEVGDIMAGGKKGSWEIVVKNIKHISSKTYVTVGVVFTEDTIDTTLDVIRFASNDLGVGDIRIITAAQFKKGFVPFEIEKEILDRHPILKYRIENMKNGRAVRGIGEKDNHQCPLILDDMCVKGNHHYPCIIKMREGCEPIGEMSDPASLIRWKRLQYYVEHNVFEDVVCKNNCLDVCVDYNNRHKEFHE